MQLSQKQKRHLRGMVHQLRPVIIVGSKGVTQALINEINAALDHHELIKIKINAGDKDERTSIADQICASTGATLVHTIGRMVAIFRQSDKAKLVLPRF